MVGTIARVMFEKGFGFIRDEAGREFFFHRSALAQWDAFDRLCLQTPTHRVLLGSVCLFWAGRVGPSMAARISPVASVDVHGDQPMRGLAPWRWICLLRCNRHAGSEQRADAFCLTAHCVMSSVVSLSLG